MTTGWQKLRVPLLERLALADAAARLGVSEEAALARAIRLLVYEQLAAEKTATQPDTPTADEPTSEVHDG